MIRLTLATLLLTTLGAACGSSSNPPAQQDSPATSASVTSVSCTGITPAMTISTNGDAYSPTSASISVGQVIQFTMPTAHNVSSTTTGLAVDFGQTACLKFTAAGTYNFKCSVHLFTGSVTVM